MAEQRTLLTVEDLLEMPDDGSRYELLDGEIVEMPPSNPEHGRVEIRIGHEFLLYVDAHDGGLVSGGDCSIVLRRSPDRVRCPDVCFWLPERAPSEIEQRRPTEIVPDIVVEVISPGDSTGEVAEKVQDWLDNGVRLVWTVYPITRMVIAYRSATDIHLFSGTDIIDAIPVLPTFSCPIANFFRQ